MSTLKSWVKVDPQSDFSIYNIPFGILSTSDRSPRVASRIGKQVIDLKAAFELGIFSSINLDPSVFESTYLNDFIALGKETTNKIRLTLQESLCDENSPLKGSSALLEAEKVKMHLPIYARDYTDFYSSIEHATNVGKMFRDPENALLPNWKHIPVGYHGRASSIIVSGEAIHRPSGQTKPADGAPVFGPSQRLDFELEMAFVVGKTTKVGESIPCKEAEEYIFGLALFNDWSARDIQKWEYVPLGPFLGKNFASSISPWIVTLEALDFARVSGPEQDPPVLPYLESQGAKNLNIHLEVGIQPEGGTVDIVSKSNFKYMYWNMSQQLAHHTVNGCNVNVGDIMASGTISGKDERSYGSMLEIAWAGQKPITLSDGSQRKFIQDGDTVTMHGFAKEGEKRVGFGTLSTKVLPAK